MRNESSEPSSMGELLEFAMVLEDMGERLMGTAIAAVDIMQFREELSFCAQGHVRRCNWLKRFKRKQDQEIIEHSISVTTSHGSWTWQGKRADCGDEISSALAFEEMCAGLYSDASRHVADVSAKLGRKLERMAEENLAMASSLRSMSP